MYLLYLIYNQEEESVDQESEHNESVGLGLVDKCFA